MGLFSDFFRGKKDKVTLEPLQTETQKQAGKTLSDIVKRFSAGYQPGKEFGRISELTSPTSYEQQGLDYLQKYIGGDVPLTGMMKQVSDVLGKTLGGEYDPFESKYYGSLRRNVEKERKQTIKQLNQQISKAGLGGSSFRAGKLGDIQQESFDRVSDIMAKLQEEERQNQLKAIITGMDFSKTQEALHTQKLSNIFGFGSLPRELAGVGYQDFLRKQGEFSDIPQIAQNLFGTNVPFGVKELEFRQPSGLNRVSNILGDVASIGSSLSDIFPGMGGKISKKIGSFFKSRKSAFGGGNSGTTTGGGYARYT